MIMRLFTIVGLLSILSSCTPNYFGYEVQKSDQFVIDSYKIREGKFSILEMQGETVAEMPEGALEEYKDVIHEDDILAISLHHPTRDDMVTAVGRISSSMGYRVTDGYVTLPDLPATYVQGLTLEEAKNRIQDEYLEQIQDVEVFMRYKERLVRKVDLLGMVSRNAIPVDGKMRLYDTLALARVPNNANLFMSYVIRDGRPLPVDMYRLVKHGDMRYNIVMRGGDKIFIADPSDSKVMVMGEVGTSRALSLPSGFMSLREALVTAGGLPFTADKRYIQVIRGNLLNPKVYVLNWDVITMLPNESLLLMPGDTVCVSAKPITEWNRFIGQLLPSFTGISTAYTTSKIMGLQ
jgi:polysaccharide biosynthesis/export protein